MAASKRPSSQSSQSSKKTKHDAGSQEDPSAFEMELALFDEEEDFLMELSQEQKGNFIAIFLASFSQLY